MFYPDSLHSREPLASQIISRLKRTGRQKTIIICLQAAVILLLLRRGSGAAQQ